MMNQNCIIFNEGRFIEYN